MTFESMKNFRFDLKNIKIVDEEHNTDEDMASVIRLETDDVPNGVVTAKPRRYVEKASNVAGWDKEETEKRPYPIDQLPKEWRNLRDLLYEHGVVRVTATVTKKDNSKDPNSDDDGVYHFINPNSFDTIRAKPLSEAEEEIEERIEKEEAEEEVEDEEGEEKLFFSEEDGEA